MTVVRAAAGRPLVVQNPAEGPPGRDGESVGLHSDDGTSPYDVRWSDTGGVSLVLPGPDAHVPHLHRPRRTTERA